MKHDFYESAKPRYQKILDLYPETPSAAEAKTKLDRANARIEKEGPEGGSHLQIMEAQTGHASEPSQRMRSQTRKFRTCCRVGILGGQSL